MALRQKYSLVDRLMGTVTAHTIEKSDIPVMAIPSGCQYLKIDHILFPSAMNNYHNLSDSEEEALFWLYNFSNFLDYPTVQFVHVVLGEGVDISFNNKPFPDMKYTQAFAKNVEEGIHHQISKNSFQLISFYKEHRSFWERLYHSSLTRKLLFKSRIPLLVFS